MRRTVIAVLLILTAVPASAQELIFFGGSTSHAGFENHSYFWAIEYMQGLGPNAAVSFTWLNEGHLTDHHRDGHAAQVWLRTTRLGGRLALAAGIGPYMYFDTTPVARGRSQDDHGFAAIFSVSATWYTESRWLAQLRSNWIEASSSIDTFSVVLGLGYQLDPPPSTGPLSHAPRRERKTTENEITAFYGRAIVNDFHTNSEKTLAIEYRRGLGRYVDWTVGWLKEGDDARIFREGPITQLWLVRSFFDERFALGAGAGIHVDFGGDDPCPGEEKKSTFARIISVTAAFRLTPAWSARVVWHRMMTNYDRDTDIILGGIGYRF